MLEGSRDWSWEEAEISERIPLQVKTTSLPPSFLARIRKSKKVKRLTTLIYKDSEEELRLANSGRLSWGDRTQTTTSGNEYMKRGGRGIL